MRLSTFIPLIVALGAGVVAVWVGRGMIERAQEGAEPVAAAVAVMVAKTEIPYAAAITADMLVSKEFGGFPLPGRFGKPEDLIGRVSATKIVRNTPILANMLAEKGQVPGAEYQIPQAYRAEPVLVKAYTVADLHPGNRVDVLYSPEQRRGSYGGGRTLKTRLQNIEVFSVGDRRKGMEQGTKSDGKGQPSRGRSSSTSGGSRSDVAVKLLVRTADVKLLREAHMNGTIELSMRAVGDDTIYDMPEEADFDSGAVAQAPGPKETVPSTAILPPVPIFTTVRIFEGDDKPRVETFQVGTKPATPAEAAESGQADTAGSSEAVEPVDEAGEPD